MSDEDIELLMNLDPQKFEYKEWLALKYAQDWAFLEGEEPMGEYMADFKAHYTKRERAYILKTMRFMRFANNLGNLVLKRAWRHENEGATIDSCTIGDKIHPERE